LDSLTKLMKKKPTEAITSATSSALPPNQYITTATYKLAISDGEPFYQFSTFTLTRDSCVSTDCNKLSRTAAQFYSGSSGCRRKASFCCQRFGYFPRSHLCRASASSFR
jgi:hypothetical protein